MWKAVSTVAFVLVIGIGAKWAMDGKQIFSKNKQQMVVKDELFGTESITWKEGFWLGADIAGPAALALLGIGGFGLYRSRKGGPRV